MQCSDRLVWEIRVDDCFHNSVAIPARYQSSNRLHFHGSVVLNHYWPCRCLLLLANNPANTVQLDKVGANEEGSEQ